MKKIKGIKQLEAAKKNLKQQQYMLEVRVKENWRELKEGLKPVNMVKDTFNTVLKNKAEANLGGGGIFKNAVLYGVSLLAKKVFDRNKKDRSGKSCD